MLIPRKCNIFILLCTALFWGAACERAPEPAADSVAVVNGESIPLRLLEAVQDFGSVGLGTTRQDSVESLKKQYGESLAALIVRTLVSQELKKAGLDPGQERLERLEAEVRRDYDDDEFENALTEDNISLDIWRELMRLQLAMEIFSNDVLKSRVYAPLVEMEEFYETHKSKFKLPRTYALKHVSGPEHAPVAAARSDYLKKDGRIAPSDNLYIASMNMRAESVPQEWRKEVLALAAGQATAIKSYGGLYQFVALTAISQERQLSLLEAYPLVESILLEEKLGKEFDEWLAKALAGARIRLSAHLAPASR